MAEDGASEAPAPTSSNAAGREAVERRQGGRKRKRVASNKRESALQQRDGCVICLCPLPNAGDFGSRVFVPHAWTQKGVILRPGLIGEGELCSD
jgi:hypothetical protein